MSYLLAVRKGEDVMSTMTGNLPRTILFGVIGTLVIAGAVKLARADVASDKPGAILVFPKIVVDTSGVLGPPTDTEIQVTNTSDRQIAARCFIVDATSHCSNAPSTACTLAGEADPTTRRCAGGACLQDNCIPTVQRERDFLMTLTKRQPISWKASEGLSGLPCDALTNQGGPGCYQGQSNSGAVLAVPEDPFVGEIKCVEADPATFAPISGLDPVNGYIGDLKGEATIVSTSGTAVDARKYNGIGIQAVAPSSDEGLTLAIGGPTPEYNGCPKLLILDNLFDNAEVVTHGGASTGMVTTDLTFVPCTEDLLNQLPTSAILQFVVFNEFEQRFSTSIGFSCFKEVQLSDIDSRPGPFGNAQSIFNVAVEGTLSGETQIRPVAGATFDNRVLAISEEFWECTSGPDGQCSAATNVDLVQGAGNGDQLSIPPPD